MKKVFVFTVLLAATGFSQAAVAKEAFSPAVVRDRVEDVRDRREDVRDRREDKRDALHQGGRLDRIEDRFDRREDVRDLREDRRDRKRVR